MRFNLLHIKLLGIIMVFYISLLAQDKEEEPKLGWINEAIGSLNLTQTSFDNWQQGGENSLSWQLNLNGKFENNQEKTNWVNSGKVSYGKIKVSDAESRKSIDEIKVESVFTYLLDLYVNPYIAASAETQFTKGYNYTETGKFAISNFLDPGYFTQSVGIGYTPAAFVKTRVGAALKETVSDTYGYADDPDTIEIETLRTEIGAESVTDFERKLSENILFTSKLELFSNLKAFDEIDVKWDTIFSAKVSKYINVNFNIKLFYDKNISTQRQLMQALAFGLTYNFLE